MSLTTERMEISGVAVDVATLGGGLPGGKLAGDRPTLLFLHGGYGLAGHEACLEALAKTHRVIAPSLPGFEHSELPRAYSGIDDLAYFGLDLASHLGLENATLVGSCFGGWVAAEMAVRSTARFSRLVLIDALGVKFGDHLARDITDIHALYPKDVEAALYADPAKARRDTTALSDAELTAIVRNSEALALFGWKPYMHNPKLANWLHRVDIPALVLWGERDGMVSMDYGRDLARAIPGARFESIADAGHYPSLEQPAATADLITGFTGPAG
jgi:pimeloyl-ACP methyl ester carboxylesterase